MQTVTIDILNSKVFKLLQDLELLQLIRLRKEKARENISGTGVTKYKGMMSKQSLSDIDSQLKEMRSEWD